MTIPVRRPAIVTALAYLFLTSMMTLLRAYDAKASIGKVALYPGSAFPVPAQWAWHAVWILLTAAITVGVFRGWRWARWLALAGFATACAVTAPLRDDRQLPAYVFWLAMNVGAFGLLFFAPAAKRYFSGSTRPERAFALRAVLSTTLLIVAVFTAHSIGYAAFWKALPASFTWGSSAVFLLPALLLSALARWDLRRSAREMAAALLAVSFALAALQVGVFLRVHYWRPIAMLGSGWLQSLLLTAVLGIAGLALAIWVARTRQEVAP